MKHTITVLVENRAGVLSKVAGLFSRRGFNIASLAVGETEDPTVSRMTIIADGNDYTVEQIEKQLNKLIPVIKVKTLKEGSFVSGILTYYKVSAPQSKRAELFKIAELMNARVADAAKETITLEFSGDAERTEALENLLRPYGIKEVVSTGLIAMEKGDAPTNRPVNK